MSRQQLIKECRELFPMINPAKWITCPNIDMEMAIKTGVPPKF